MVGNTVADSVLQGVSLSKKVDVQASFGLTPGKYFFLTLHRPANVDTAEVLTEIFHFLSEVHTKTKLPFFLPLHPRTAHTIEKFNIQVPDCVHTTHPVGYLDCLALEANAAAIFTDSGGIQEEACILGVPCITLRDSTERPETVTVGANVVVNRDIKKAFSALEHFAKKTTWKNPFGDGTTAKKILEILLKKTQ